MLVGLVLGFFAGRATIGEVFHAFDRRNAALPKKSKQTRPIERRPIGEFKSKHILRLARRGLAQG